MSDKHLQPSTFFRVRFREIRSYAMDTLAETPEGAIAYAQTLHREFGTDEFNLIMSRAVDWEAEAEEPAERLLHYLRSAHMAVNAAPRFQVGDNDSYVVEAELARMIDRLEAGGAA